MNKAPAFQFYADAFLADANVRVMNTEQVGAYMLLIATCWVEMSLPNDIEELAALAKMDVESFQPAWERRIKRCFEYNEKRNCFLHPRLEKEIRKQKEFRKKKSDAGIESGRKRREYRQIDAEQVFDSVRTKDEHNANNEKRNCFLHPRLEKEIRKQKEFRKKKSDAGIESGRKRREYRQIDAEQVFDSVRTKDEHNANKSELSYSYSSSISKKKKVTTVTCPPTSDAVDVFEYWQLVLSKQQFSLTPARKTKILSRLRDGFTVDQLKQVIDTVSKDPFYCGENDRGKEYVDFKTIFKTKDKVEEFLFTKKKPTSIPLKSEPTKFTIPFPTVKYGGVVDDFPKKREYDN